MKSRLIFLLLPLVIFSSVFTVQKEDLPRNAFYYPGEILDNVPELATFVMDASDIAFSTPGANALVDGSVHFTINGVSIGKFHDYRSWIENRLIQYEDVERIEVLTGTDVYKITTSAKAVINFVTKDIKSTQKGFHAKSYIGSELGDPTLYLRILPKDSLPYNKEQLAAGEMSYAIIPNDSFMIKPGIQLVYMDRYSNGDEDKKGGLYGGLNSHQSMNEHRDASLISRVEKERKTFAIHAGFSDYNVFRKNILNDRYYYYEGQRGRVQSDLTLSSKTSEATLSLALYGDKGDLYENEFVHNSQTLVGGEVRVSGRKEMSKELSYFGYLTSTIDSVYREANLTSNLHDPRVISQKDNLSTAIGLQYKKFTAQLLYPVGVLTSVTFNEYIKSATSFIALENNIETGEFMHEWQFTLNAKERFNLYSTVRLTITPRKDFHILHDQWHKSLDDENNLIIPELSVYGTLSNWGKAYVYSSLYVQRLGWQNSVTLHGLYLKGAIECTGPTYWDAQMMPVSDITADDGFRSHKLDGYVTGTAMMSYPLVANKAIASIAVRNIGKKHREIPTGSMVGPVISTNLEFRF